MPRSCWQGDLPSGKQSPTPAYTPVPVSGRSVCPATPGGGRFSGSRTRPLRHPQHVAARSRRRASECPTSGSRENQPGSLKPKPDQGSSMPVAPSAIGPHRPSRWVGGGQPCRVTEGTWPHAGTNAVDLAGRPPHSIAARSAQAFHSHRVRPRAGCATVEPDGNPGLPLNVGVHHGRRPVRASVSPWATTAPSRWRVHVEHLDGIPLSPAAAGSRRACLLADVVPDHDLVCPRSERSPPTAASN